MVQVVPTLNCGGAERVCVEVARGLDRSRFEVTVLTLEPLADTRLERDLQNSGVKIHALDKRPGPDARMYPRSFRALGHYRPDILHTHLYVLPYIAPAEWLYKVPSLHTIHNLAEKDATGFVRVANSLAFRMGTIPVGISPRVAESVHRLYHSRRIPLIPNGIDVKPFRGAQDVRARWRSRNGYSQQDFLIASVGRLDPQKNYSQLISACAELRRGHRSVKLIIAGEGQCRNDLQKIIDEFALDDTVRLAGERSDVVDMLLASDLYISTSLWEGNPLSVMEAMAAGLAVIASSVGGIPDLIDDGINGILIPCLDHKILLRSVGEVINSADLRRRLGEAAREKAFDRMDVSGMICAYGKLYEELAVARSI
ncbi:glycosyltransferase [Telmatobacter sp. DSM 110680]|uniref:Glycosyltransferase n=1 Tax=Telmatobacter sp. DSM 110680 TaxID=3036704 RepID=A0AAU7DIF7_9BACT